VVTFGLLPYSAGGAIDRIPAYVWDIASGQVTPVSAYGSLQLDWLSANGNQEIVWNGNDPSRAAGELGGAISANNVVRVQDSQGFDRVIYHTPDWLLVDVRYIEDGARLALQELEPYDAARSPEIPYATRWIALDRAGNETELQTTAVYTQLRGVANGYVTLQALPSSTAGEITPEYVLDFSAPNGTITTLWTQPPQEAFSSWELVWSPVPNPTLALPPFVGR
jgi:hypothetical protein